MPTAVPATVPPGRLCTKFVPPMVFAKDGEQHPFFVRAGRPPCFLGLYSKRVSVLCPNVGRFSLICLPKILLKSTPGGPPEHFGASLGVGERKSAILRDSCAKKSAFGRLWGDPFSFFCFGPPGHTKRESQRRFKRLLARASKKLFKECVLCDCASLCVASLHAWTTHAQSHL